jgi:hypothetical protein
MTRGREEPSDAPDEKAEAVPQALPAARLSARALLERWRHLPIVDPDQFRRDVDGLYK